MISLSLTSLLIKPSPLSQPNKLKSINLIPKLNNQRRKSRSFKCRADLFQDAPFAIAIGACILNSLVFPIPNVPDEEDSDLTITSTDSRFAVMGIISFVPYFNWLSWIFAWLDTGDRRYAVYSIVYLAPYIRSNLSLSPDESWLPIASIIFCIIHIQLEASVRNGDVQGFQLFSGLTREKGVHLKGRADSPEKGKIRENIKLPSARNQSRDEVQGWGEVLKKPLDDPKSLNEDGGAQNIRKD
ncbi:hypothetical protein MKW94_026504 [Papaver nudicaule]|uniref:Uncharacterized protein n=1 Tax=Papaver nudicaule TaxID=74823 RepID=A0AA41RUV7_PAPNU|nr:hypothetical protein [Papaver nudicaule]